MFFLLFWNFQIKAYEIQWMIEEQKEFNTLITKEINETLSWLYLDWILNKDHLKNIFDNIYLIYNNNWKYNSKMYEWFIRFDKNFNFKNIEINFFPYQWNKILYIKDKIKKLLIHEIWHYISFYIDENSDNFYSICFQWNKNNCDKNGFVSDYSKTNYYEDYAETFLYWYYFKNQNWKKSSDKLNQKIKHFDNLIK